MVLIGTKLKNATLEDEYDTIVIGSGMGGLSAAAMLARAGQRVLVLERHYTAGGYTHAYLRKGFEWDVGLHYIGRVGNPREPMRQAFDFVSEGRIKWASMGEVYDSIRFQNGETFDFRAGRENFRADMKARFPEDAGAIDAYLKKLDFVNNITMPTFTAKKMAPGFARGLVQAAVDALVPDYFQKTTREVLESLTSNQKLIGVLTGQWGDYGVPPARSPFAMHALVANHYLEGGFFPVGGSSSLARGILPVIEKTGGQVVTEAGVAEILVQDNRADGDRTGGPDAERRHGRLRARGVRLDDGREVRADRIVSAAGFKNTCLDMLPASVRDEYDFPAKAKKVAPSIGHLGLYIGLNATAEELDLPRRNFWLYPSFDHDENMRQYGGPDSELPVVYISFPSAKDPDWERRYPGRATIEIIAPAPYAWFEKWQNEPWRKRGEDYDIFKEQLSERLLEYLYRELPHLRGKIAYHELSTPLSTRTFCNYSRGELYGLDHTPERFRQEWLRPKTPIEGLYMTGQDVLTCGVAAAMFAGLMTASAVLGARSVGLLPGALRGAFGGYDAISADPETPAAPGKRPRRAPEPAGVSG